MFGCCVAGRVLQTNLQQIDATHAVFELPAASSINHICVFSTEPFPDGYGATVHFFWPGKGAQLLGMLSNEKPSAIFRLRGTFLSSTAADTAPARFTFGSVATPATPIAVDPTSDVTAILGLSIEPLSDILPQIATLQSALTLAPSDLARDPTLLAERIVRHLINYISGFVGAATPETWVPMSMIVQWYESFQSKLRAGGIGFLERVE